VPAAAAIDERDRQRETRFEGAPGEHDPERVGLAFGDIEHECLDFCPICRTADVLRATLPPEFQDHWHAWQSEMLMALRALLDHYIERVEARRGRAVSVEDIPIE
jgi:hypothetical protein